MTRVRPLTLELAQWVVAARETGIPSQVEHQSRRLLLDYLAAALAGSRSMAAGIVQAYLAESQAPGPVTVLGTQNRLSAADAALANGTAAHGLEIDDGYTPGAYHPGAPVVSASLAAAEEHCSSMAELLAAVALGVEVSCRLAGAGHPATWQRGWHNTPVAGVFGAAVAVSALLGADVTQTTNALGLAGSHAGGLFEFLGKGAEVKRLHAGKAARDGLVCAELALRGLTGPDTVLEGEAGYRHAFAGGELDEDHLMGDLGGVWRMLRTYVKPYPCCRHLHGPIDGVLELAAEHSFQAAQVRAVEIETYPVALKHAHTHVDDLLDAQMSIPYAVAVAAVYGAPTLEHFSDEVRRDPEVQRLVPLVTVREGADCTRDYPAMRPARVRISTEGGVFETRIDQPLGEPDRPVGDEALTAKLHRLADPVCGSATVDELAGLVWHGDNADELLRVLGKVGDGQAVRL